MSTLERIFYRSFLVQFWCVVLGFTRASVQVVYHLLWSPALYAWNELGYVANTSAVRLQCVSIWRDVSEQLINSLFLNFGPHCGFTTCFHTIFYCILLLVSLGYAINRGLAHAFLFDVFYGLKLMPFSKWEMTRFVNSCLVTVFMMKIFK